VGRIISVNGVIIAKSPLYLALTLLNCFAVSENVYSKKLSFGLLPELLAVFI
jgi:hypothetical protein